MSRVTVNEQYLQDTADAIRAKTGEIGTYKPSQFASAINNISSCGSWTDISNAVIYSGTDDDRVTIKAITNGSSYGSYVFIMISCDEPTTDDITGSIVIDVLYRALSYTQGFLSVYDSSNNVWGIISLIDCTVENEWTITDYLPSTDPWRMIISYIRD